MIGLLAAAPLTAQQPPAVQRPIQQAQRAAAQPAQGQPLAAPPATHAVQQGETLWSLAQQFLGDPLLWPEIYRLNTDVIEDPHWIYPGEELRLVAAAAAAAPAAGNLNVTPGVDTARGGAARAAAAAAQTTEAPTIFSAAAVRQAQEQNTIELRNEQAYRAVRAGEYYGSGFVADSRTLETGTLVGTVEQAAIRRITTRTTAALYANVVVAPPSGQTFQRGDILLTYTVDRQIRGYGDLVVPTGLLRVTSDGAAGQNVTATVLALYSQVNDGQRLTKVAPFRYESSARSEPTDSGVVGEVIALRGEREIANVQEVIFVSRGADDGVHLGDIFRITSAPRAGPARDQAEAIVVYTSPKTATCVILQLSQPDIHPGATARQVRRMPS